MAEGSETQPEVWSRRTPDGSEIAAEPIEKGSFAGKIRPRRRPSRRSNSRPPIESLNPLRFFNDLDELRDESLRRILSLNNRVLTIDCAEPSAAAAPSPGIFENPLSVTVGGLRFD